MHVIVASGFLDMSHMSSLLTQDPYPYQDTKPHPLLKPSFLKYLEGLHEASVSLLVNGQRNHHPTSTQPSYTLNSCMVETPAPILCPVQTLSSISISPTSNLRYLAVAVLMVPNRHW